MAGGNLSPRQKMINMMYLVLTALLALNVSREVMDAFYEVMKGQVTSIETVERQNASIYQAFNAAALENPVKAGPWRDEALKVKSQSDQLYQQIATIKQDLLDLTGGVDEEGKPLKMDKKEPVAKYLINDGKGGELKSAMEAYRNFLVNVSGDNATLVRALNETFNTEDHINKSGTPEPWEKAKFEHYPLISVLTFLTGMQSDVRTAEANVIDFLQSNIGKTDFKFTDVIPMVVPKSTFVPQGDVYEADVFLAAYDATQDPRITINGRELSQEEIIDGRGKVKLPANTTGENTWTGEIILHQNGEDKIIPINGSYNVAPPSVVISATKMNVLYRGVDNPMEISIPGVDPSNIVVSNAEMKRQSDGSFIADVTRFSGQEMEIKVSVKDGDEVKLMGSKKYRIKMVPEAFGSIFGKRDEMASAGLLKQGTVDAKFKNFEFDLPVEVTSFTLVVPGEAPINCVGNRLNNAARAAVDGVKPGSTVIFRNIEAKTKEKGLPIDVASFTIDIN